LTDAIKQIDNIPVTRQYTDREGRYIGKELVRWVDVKSRVMEILHEFEQQKKEGEADEGGI